MSLWDRGNEVCTERNCSLVKVLSEGGKHYRWQCGSDHVEGYGNTDEDEDAESQSESKGSSRWGKVLGNMSGGWQ